MKNSHHVIRHAPSGELWKFCMDRLRELRGADTRERDLANVLGFEHSRAVRWKEGQMYVDRAEYLLRLADAIEVEPMLLVQLAAGDISVEQAQRQLNRISRQAAEESKKRGKGSGGAAGKGAGAAAAEHQIDRAADGAQFATDPGRFESATRGVALLVAANGAGRAELAAAVARHADIGALVATSLPMGITLAERYRPELAFLDMGLGGRAGIREHSPPVVVARQVGPPLPGGRRDVDADRSDREGRVDGRGGQCGVVPVPGGPVLVRAGSPGGTPRAPARAPVAGARRPASRCPRGGWTSARPGPPICGMRRDHAT